VTLGDWITEVRRLVADPEALPVQPSGGEPVSAPDPRWSRGDVLRVAQARLDWLAGRFPRAVQTGTAYAVVSPRMPEGDEEELDGIGVSVVPQALAHLTAAALLADVLDAGSAESATTNMQSGMAMLEGW